MTNEELNSVMAKAKEQFRKSKPLWGKIGAFCSDEFLLKLVYQAYRNIKKEMDNALGELVLNRLATMLRFEDRFKIL